MIEGKKYIEIVKTYFSFLVNEFDYQVYDEKIRGNAFYDLQYQDKNKNTIISIPYENIDDYLQVIIFILQNGELPNYDDKTKTIHLNILNARILSIVNKSEVSLNNKYFDNFTPQTELERKLLKGAKELRLCMNKLEGKL